MVQRSYETILVLYDSRESKNSSRETKNSSRELVLSV